MLGYQLLFIARYMCLKNNLLLIQTTCSLFSIDYLFWTFKGLKLNNKELTFSENIISMMIWIRGIVSGKIMNN